MRPFWTLCVSLATGGLMIANGMGLVNAGHPQVAYATGGWLKASHGVFMHGILVLPALAWLLTFTPWSEPRRLRIVLLASAGYVLLAGAVLGMNVAGVAFDRTPLAGAALAGLGGLAFAGAWLLALVGVGRRDAGADSPR